MIRKCQVWGCNNKHYALGFCKNHYEKNRRHKEPKLHKCAAFQYCHRIIPIKKKYCSKHAKKVLKKQPLDLSIKLTAGKYNYNWNGGTSEYKNHSLMKRNRRLLFKKNGGHCDICGGNAEVIHHLDGGKENHDINNLQLLCKRCHYKIHSGRKNKTSKFIREYGMTLKGIADKFGGTGAKYLYWHKKNYLKKFLADNEVLCNNKPC